MAKRRFGDSENLESSDEKMPDEKPAEPVKPPTEKLETKPESKAAEPELKKPPAQCVPLKVFASVAGPKPDQMAGFVYHATKQKLGPMSVPDWKAEYKKFMAQPVK